MQRRKLCASRLRTPKPSLPKDLTGHNIGLYRVLERSKPDLWRCQHRVTAAYRYLRTKTLLKQAHLRAPGTPYSLPPNLHRRRRHLTYRTWHNMRQRCFNPNNPKYRRYGGRGITIHPCWHTFDHFVSDMGLKPFGLSIDRRNNDDIYKPSNCRWATRLEQARNKSPRSQTT